MAGSALFKVPERAGRSNDASIAKRVNSAAKRSSTTVKGGGGLVEKINTARALIEKNLGYMKDNFIVIQDEKVLDDYICKSMQNGIIAIDTETTGLDPMLDSIVGISICTRNEKAAYIPINHKSYITGIRVESQLPVATITKAFSRISEGALALAEPMEIVMFNAPFDMRVLRHGIGVRVNCTFDCYLAARLLNENEGAGNNNLKALHHKYCLDGDMTVTRFGDLFDGVSFDLVPVSLGYIYAAYDAQMTLELYDFQYPFVTADMQECMDHDLTEVAGVFSDIEMPCVKVVADMEDTGVAFDFEVANKLHEKYHKEFDEKKAKAYDTLSMWSTEIAMYKAKNPSNKLSDPVNIDSPVQVAILLYDVMGCKSQDQKSPRGTGEDILKKIDNDFCKALLEYRAVGKLLSTYIDKLPECVNPKDGRIHCKFNQYGADTGRFSSSDPNLQNIPSHNTDIRQMFKATPGYALMSSDFSQQEPKGLAAMCRRDGDPQMYDVFMAGKDLYSEIASKAFGVSYEECREFRPDGTTNKAGKERRSQAKTILLGVLYGRGVDSIAEQLGVSTNKAREIKDAVFKGFPAIKKFETDSIKMAQTKGFVTTICGRKRRLPSMMLPDYEVVWKDGAPPDNDPLDFDDDLPFENGSTKEVPLDIQRKWLARVKNTPFFKRRQVFEAANEEGLWIIDHTKDKDVTKVVNARVQGSAADLTKAAMIALHNDIRLKELGFRMLIPVHDEIIAECPIENLQECSKLLADTMCAAAEKILDMPIKCDVACSYNWYGEEIKV